MRVLTTLFAIGIVPALVGCASATKTTVLAPVGPAPEGPAVASQEGFLEVFSARQRHEPVNINGEVFVEGNQLSDDMVYDLAHSSYAVYGQDGRLIKHERNARGMNDENPTRVALPAGSYEVQAQARDYGLVTVPVVIRSGQLTTVHLQGNWAPTAGEFHEHQFVWLGDQPVGWSAAMPGLNRAENAAGP